MDIEEGLSNTGQADIVDHIMQWYSKVSQYSISNIQGKLKQVLDVKNPLSLYTSNQ